MTQGLETGIRASKPDAPNRPVVPTEARRSTGGETWTEAGRPALASRARRDRHRAVRVPRARAPRQTRARFRHAREARCSSSQARTRSRRRRSRVRRPRRRHPPRPRTSSRRTRRAFRWRTPTHLRRGGGQQARVPARRERPFADLDDAIARLLLTTSSPRTTRTRPTSGPSPRCWPRSRRTTRLPRGRRRRRTSRAEPEPKPEPSPPRRPPKRT